MTIPQTRKWVRKRVFPKFQEKSSLFPQKNHSKPQIFYPLVKWADKVPNLRKKRYGSPQACPLSRLSVLWLSINLSCRFIAFTVCPWSLSHDADKILVNCPITSVASQPGRIVIGQLVVSLKPSPQPWGLEGRLLASASLCFSQAIANRSAPPCLVSAATNHNFFKVFFLWKWDSVCSCFCHLPYNNSCCTCAGHGQRDYQSFLWKSEDPYHWDFSLWVCLIYHFMCCYNVKVLNLFAGKVSWN